MKNTKGRINIQVYIQKCFESRTREQEKVYGLPRIVWIRIICTCMCYSHILLWHTHTQGKKGTKPTWKIKGVRRCFDHSIVQRTYYMLRGLSCFENTHAQALAQRLCLSPYLLVHFQHISLSSLRYLFAHYALMVEKKCSSRNCRSIEWYEKCAIPNIRLCHRIQKIGECFKSARYLETPQSYKCPSFRKYWIPVWLSATLSARNAI